MYMCCLSMSCVAIEVHLVYASVPKFIEVHLSMSCVAIPTWKSYSASKSKARIHCYDRCVFFPHFIGYIFMFSPKLALRILVFLLLFVLFELL